MTFTVPYFLNNSVAFFPSNITSRPSHWESSSKSWLTIHFSLVLFLFGYIWGPYNLDIVCKASTHLCCSMKNFDLFLRLFELINRRYTYIASKFWTLSVLYTKTKPRYLPFSSTESLLRHWSNFRYLFYEISLSSCLKSRT